VKKGIWVLGLLCFVIGLVGASAGCQEVKRGVSGVMPYHEESFTVPALHEQPISLELNAGDSLEG